MKWGWKKLRKWIKKRKQLKNAHTYLHGVLALRIWRRNHFKLAFLFFFIVSSLPFCLLISFLYACIQAYFFCLLLYLSVSTHTELFASPYFFFYTARILQTIIIRFFFLLHLLFDQMCFCARAHDARPSTVFVKDMPLRYLEMISAKTLRFVSNSRRQI